jgi:hypothetical protein
VKHPGRYTTINTADSPYLFDLGPVEGRKVVDQVQAGEIAKPDVAIEDLSVPGGPRGHVSIRILRPRGLQRLEQEPCSAFGFVDDGL